jgi:fused signal recognition particle receptor
LHPDNRLNSLNQQLMSFFKRIFSKEKKETLDRGLAKSKRTVFDRLSRAIVGKKDIDADVLDQLEEALITSDVGVDTTMKLIKRIEDRTRSAQSSDAAQLFDMLREEALDMIGAKNDAAGSLGASGDIVQHETEGPYVMLVVGVNGVGKTTTIGKLSHQLRSEGKSVTMGAADTFRAAAVAQLGLWAERTGADFVSQGQDADPAAVAYDTIHSAVAKQRDVVLIDTAGRLHNKKHLMEELAKIKRVMRKIAPGVPHEVLLVLDGSTGQNAMEQARKFSEVTEVTGLILTKLDGTAKGGVVLGIADQLNIPVRFIGVGEGPEDLQAFEPTEFIDSLFPRSDEFSTL